MGFKRSCTPALVVVALGLAMPGLASAAGAHRVGILDRCDPATFNAMFGDGTCVMRNGGVHVGTFLERVNPKDGGHQAWRFTPERLRLKSGDTLLLDNRGGETHTFTEVVAFGGGFVPELNATLPPGTPLAVPIGPLRFIAAGEQIDFSVPAGTHLFECLIHPWMQTTVVR
jgi:plastocyanin